MFRIVSSCMLLRSTQADFEWARGHEIRSRMMKKRRRWSALRQFLLMRPVVPVKRQCLVWLNSQETGRSSEELRLLAAPSGVIRAVAVDLPRLRPSDVNCLCSPPQGLYLPWLGSSPQRISSSWVVQLYRDHHGRRRIYRRLCRCPHPFSSLNVPLRLPASAPGILRENLW